MNPSCFFLSRVRTLGLGLGLVSMAAPLAAASGAAAAWQWPRSPLPMGVEDKVPTLSTQELAPGVSYYQFKSGGPGADDAWKVDLAWYTDPAAARPALDALTLAGFAPRLEASAAKLPTGQPIGYWLSSGHFETRALAQAHAATIKEALPSSAFASYLRHTSAAGQPSSGPWLVNVVAIRPRAAARLSLQPPSGDQIGQANLGGSGETTSAAAARVGALAAINGGYFTIVTPTSTSSAQAPRSPVGAFVLNGRLLAVPSGNRPALVIDSHGKDGRVRLVQKVEGRITIVDTRSDIRDHALNNELKLRGINRPILGFVVNCGYPADLDRSQMDRNCENHDDLVLYDNWYLKGAASNTQVHPRYQGATYEVRVDAGGRIVEGHAQLGSVAPAGGYVLQGLGQSAQWLQSRAESKARLRIRQRVWFDGVEQPLPASRTVLEAGPTLVHPRLAAKDLMAQAAAEGFARNFMGEDESRWYDGWVVNRNPRTMVGTARDGTVLLVEVPGKQPDISVGLSIDEGAALMRWLGAEHAMNLDGGGSSNMVIQGRSVGYPSDVSGERSVGNSLLVTAPK